MPIGPDAVRVQSSLWTRLIRVMLFTRQLWHNHRESQSPLQLSVEVRSFWPHGRNITW